MLYPACVVAPILFFGMPVNRLPAALLLVLVALTAACRQDGALPLIDRLESRPGPSETLAVPRDRQSLTAILLGDPSKQPSLTEVATPAEAADAVRAGRATAALTLASAASGLTTYEVESIPIALIVPLTFPVEGVSAGHARDILAGRLTDWRVAGGPSLPVRVAVAVLESELPTVRGALGEDVRQPLAAREADAARSTPGLVQVRLWDNALLSDGTLLGYKTLSIDGATPGEPRYPLMDQRVIATATPADGKWGRMAESMRQRLEGGRSAVVTLDAVGDIMLGRSVARQIAEHGSAFPFEQVRPLLAGADVRFGNLELPLTERGAPAKKDYVFRAPPSSVAALTGAGFNILSMANNHALDYGAEGLMDTLAALDRAGIAAVGAGRTAEQAHTPALLTVKGIRIAFLAYTNTPNDSISGWVAEADEAEPERPGVAWGRPDAIRRDVAAAKARADVVIVSLHSGFEYTATPNGRQRELAKAAVDAGAALVLGGHPHVLQGVEFYKGAPIIYSLGNFVFDLDDDDRRQPGMPSVLTTIFRVTITPRGVTAVRFLPAVIDQQEGRPVPVSGAAAKPVLDRLYRLTDGLN